MLLDTPPIIPVSDAGVLGRYVDASIFAVRWDKTPRDIAAEGIKRLHEYGVYIMGCVLTMVDREKASRYGYSLYKDPYFSGRSSYYVD